MECSLRTVKSFPCLCLINEYNFSLQRSPSTHIAVEQCMSQQRVTGNMVSASYKQRYSRVPERVHTQMADIQWLTSSKQHVNRCW